MCMDRIMNRFVWQVILVTTILFSGTSATLALDPHKTINQYGHKVWLAQNGFPAHTVNVALQTRDGYLWFGTSAGLFRFDGVRFEEVATNPENEKAPESITALCETRDGSLWLGTAYTGLRQFKDGKKFIYGLKEGFFNTQVRQLHENLDGKLLIGTAIGLYGFSEGKFYPILLKPNYIPVITEDSIGRLWVGTHEGVRILPSIPPTDTISIMAKDGLPDNVITAIYSDRQQNIWIGTANGLTCWQDGRQTTYTITDGLSDNHVNSIFEDRDSNLWIGTQNGINRLTKGKWTTYTNADGLTDNNVLSFDEDQEGSLWICTSDGLNQLRDVNITSYTTKDGLANNYISSVIEMPDKSLYFFSDKGANITRIKNGKITRYDISVGPVYLARDGSLWMGQSGVLYHFVDDQFKRYDAKNGLPKKWISAITEDDKSLIFYADHDGIFRFVDEQVKPFLLKSGQQHPPSEYIVCFYPQQHDLMWMGTADWLSKIQSGTITNYTTADGLAGDWVSSIYDDQQGGLWFSSPQGGLTRYRNGKFTAYNAKVGLFCDEIYCVLRDDHGDLWLSSPKGIGYVSRKDLDDFEAGRITMINTRVYSTADGMKTDECFGDWQPAGWKTHDGRLWFATKKGAVLIDPKVLKRNQILPPVLIEKVMVDQQTVPLGQLIRFPANKQKFDFHYAALSFLIPERVLFKYKLEGYDREWVDAGTRRVAYYTNLPYGEYRFRVMACNNDGLWNEAKASFAFYLKPHFYETFWFYGLVLIAVAGIAFGIYRLRVLQLLRKEKELQARVQEALANIKTLGGLIPICANCKKIRNDKGYWDQLEGYIQTHSEAKFSHGLCPECAEKLYPEIFSETETDEDVNTNC